MDAMIFLAFVLMVVIGVALLAFALKFLDVNEQAADPKQGTRPPAGVSRAESIAASMPAFFGRPRASHVRLATLGYNERLPKLHEIDHRHILWALEQTGGNRVLAAQLLGTNERTFDLLVTRHCGTSQTAGRALDALVLTPEPWVAQAGPVEPLDDRLFAFLQSHIWSEQALAREFVHLPSIDSLYRQPRPTLNA